MLLIDGVKYVEWTPADEDEFERMVKEHAKDVFGEESIYLEKHRLRTKSGIGSIPDGYVIILGAQPQWHIVEVELSAHPLYEHIVAQISKFINGIKNPSTQKDIVDALFTEINSDEFDRLHLKKAIGTAETYKFLADLVSRPPVVTIIIEKRTEQLDEAIGALAHPQIKIVELRTFTREGVGLNVHAHLFEPLCKPEVVWSPLAEVTKHELTALRASVSPRSIKVRFEMAKTAHPYHLLRFEKQDRGFLPGYKQEFALETDIGERIARVTSAQGNPTQGDPEAGNYITGSLGEWAKQHPGVKSGDILTLQEITPKARYRLIWH